METSAHIVFFLTLLLSAQVTLLASSSSVHADSEFVSGLIGQTVTLPCYYNRSDFIWVAWYKQMVGKKLHLISQMFRYQKTIMKNPRYSVKSQNQKYHLNILNLQDSDSATYHCTICFAASIDFLNVVTVNVKGSGSTIQTSVHQSSSENIHAGDSVTLNCTVHTGSCDEEHRVYWFKDSEDSHPGLIYTHGGRNDQCERKNNTQTHSCVYELPIKNLTEYHAGIYYCAVVSCGHILFGNGTKLDLTDSAVPLNSVILNTLVGLLTVMSVLVVFLLFLLWKNHKSNNCTSTEERSPAAPLRSSEAENKDTESLHYAAVNVKKSSKTKSQKNDSNKDCVYASVRQQN
uniref:Novel immune-type receptor 14 n=1 Tax=Oryzias latipes TaxID=8090 RepID=A0A3P9IA50_ORYLA